MKTCFLQVCLDDDDSYLPLAQSLLDVGRAEGGIPDDRPDFTGGEDAIFVYRGEELAAASLLGVVVFYQPAEHDMLFVDVLYVVPEYRRLGIASHLLDFVKLHAASSGIARVEFGTLVGNQAMRSLGRRAGFTERAVFMSLGVAL